MRTCKDCQEAKPLSEFPHWNRKRGGVEVSTRCHPCRKAFRIRTYQENKTRERETNREWHLKNRPWSRQEKRDYINKWRRAHKDRRRSEFARRRTRINEGGGEFSPQEFIDLCYLHDNKCLACKRDNIKLTADHIIPVSLGGSSWITNIQPLCQSCNSSKGAKIIDYREGEDNALV